MGEIDAPLHEIESVGAGIEGVAPTLTTLARAATGVTGTVSEPPATSAALDEMASRWAASATRMEDEIAALGVAAGATAVAYRTVDETSMTPAITSGRPVERIGDGGPVPIVEIRNSFQDENPALVSLQFYWPD